MVKIHLSNQDILAPKLNFFFYFLKKILKKIYDVGTHKKHFSEALLSSHNMFSLRNKNKKPAESNVAPAGIKSYKLLQCICIEKNLFCSIQETDG